MEALLRPWLHPEAHLGYKLPDPIKASSAYFMYFILLELAVSTYKGKKVYSLRQSLSNLSAGFFLVFLGEHSGLLPQHLVQGSARMRIPPWLAQRRRRTTSHRQKYTFLMPR